MRVAVLMGGPSSEREVSLETGAAISSALRELGHDVSEIDVGPNLARELAEGEPEVVFLALHGRYGEDGTVQGFLEVMRIPYTGSGVRASAITIDKITTKAILRHYDVPLVDDVQVSRAEWADRQEGTVERVQRSLGYPVMVKPSSEGSSVGASVVRDEEGLKPAMELALGMDSRVVVERYIEGRLLTVGILGEEERVLPVLEIKPRREFYDFEAKYTTGESEYEVPARIPDEVARRAQDVSLVSHRALGCDDISRTDLILDQNHGLFFLEINTMPGMTTNSLIPKAASAAGMSFNEIVSTVLSGARLKLNPGGP